MFKSIRSLAVYVSDMDRAKEFYTKVLGFEVAFDLGDSLCFLKSRNGKIDIYLEAGMKPSKTDNKTCRLSVFLQAEKPAKEVFAELKAAGVRVLQDVPEPVDDETACFQFLDPDGNIIEVSAGIRQV
jgi:catechol 2,3-dioxygenase-like lactoylglutathione lyase family enzyme